MMTVMALDVEVLTAVMRNLTASVLGAAGWEPDAEWAPDDDGSAGWWRRAHPDGSVLRAALFCDAGSDEDSDDGPHSGEAAEVDRAVVDASVRLSFEPAEQAGTALGVLGCGGVTVGVGELIGGDSDAEASRWIATVEEARAAAGFFLDAIVEQALAWAEPLAAVDALRERIRRDAGEEAERIRRETGEDEEDRWRVLDDVVFLGAAGRVDQAKAALTGQLQAHRDDSGRFRLMPVAEVTRWLADGRTPIVGVGRSAPDRSGRSGPSGAELVGGVAVRQTAASGEGSHP